MWLWKMQFFFPGLVKKVYLVHRRDELRAEKFFRTAYFACHNVELVWDSVPVSVEGEDKVTALKVRNVKRMRKRKFRWMECLLQ